MVLALIFRSVIHFDLISVYRVKQGSNFILLQVDIQFSQHYLLKKLFCPHLNDHCIIIENHWPWLYGFISGLSILFCWSICLSLCQYQPHCLTCCSFIVSFDIGKYESSNFFLFQHCFGYSGTLAALHELENWLFQSFCKKRVGKGLLEF